MTECTGTPVEAVSEEVARRLRAVGRAVSPEEIGDLWIFPPLEDVEHSAEFLLFTRKLEEGKLRLYSARLRRVAADPDENGMAAGNGTAAAVNGTGHAAGIDGHGSGASGGGPPANGNGNGAHGHGASVNGNGAGPRAATVRQQITEHGTVPADRIPGLVIRLRRRLGDDGEPRHVLIDGRAERWHELLPQERGAVPENGDGTVEAPGGGS